MLPGRHSSNSPDETFQFGEAFAANLSGGEVVLLSGPLGAGKTLFVKGMARAIGVDDEEVTSPSFTLVNIYEGRLKIYHVDLYRLDEGATAAHAVDLDELLSDEDSVIVIEWAERLGRYPLPDPIWDISIVGDGAQPREISIKTREKRRDPSRSTG